MALSPGQPSNKPGGFGTFDKIGNIDYVRHGLALKLDWKPRIENVVTYEVVKDLPVLSGPVGPQIDLAMDALLKGQGSQINFMVPRNEIMDYIKVISEEKI